MIPVTAVITRIAAERFGVDFPDAGAALGSEQRIQQLLKAAGLKHTQVRSQHAQTE